MARLYKFIDKMSELTEDLPLYIVGTRHVVSLQIIMSCPYKLLLIELIICDLPSQTP
ncbi:MAG: hypothetical protein RIM23_07645 [Coleofasciculus sp. G3-WIS-01]